MPVYQFADGMYEFIQKETTEEGSSFHRYRSQYPISVPPNSAFYLPDNYGYLPAQNIVTKDNLCQVPHCEFKGKTFSTVPTTFLTLRLLVNRDEKIDFWLSANY